MSASPFEINGLAGEIKEKTFCDLRVGSVRGCGMIALLVVRKNDKVVDLRLQQCGATALGLLHAVPYWLR